jgi:predicted small lipoprotein YifL
MNKKSLAALSAAALVVASLSLTACGNKAPKELPASETKVLVEEAAPTATIGFDSPLDLGDGVTITVSSPSAFTPTIFASNFVKGQVANSFNIDVKNGGTKALDLSVLSLIVESGKAFCAEVLDGDSGITGAPLDPIAAGASTSFKYGIACSAKKGAPLNLKITLGTNVIAVDGTIA